MNEILKFRVSINGLENKIWRVIEINNQLTLADLAYTILASFNSLTYHLYNINYNGNIYGSNGEKSDLPGYVKLNAITTRLKDLDLKENDEMEMDYDFGSTTTFDITYLESNELKNLFDVKEYPKIVEGAGLGMLEDISEYDLRDIVEETDELGYSKHYFTNGYETDRIYDYRNYDLKRDNENLKGLILQIKNGYEIPNKRK